MTGIPSDHPSVATVRARLDADATGRLRVAIDPDGTDPDPLPGIGGGDPETGGAGTGTDSGIGGGAGTRTGGETGTGTGVGADVVRVVVGGTDRHARPRRAHGGDSLLIPGVYDAPRIARDPGGEATDRLAGWVEARGLSAGDPVALDVLEAGVRYGLRVPGERVVYGDRRALDDSLASIARDVEARTSDVEARTSDVEARTSDGEE